LCARQGTGGILSVSFFGIAPDGSGSTSIHLEDDRVRTFSARLRVTHPFTVASTWSTLVDRRPWCRPRLFGLLLALTFPAIASGQTPYFHYELIDTPHQPGAIDLPVENKRPDLHEQWFLQNRNIGVRNVVQPTLTPVLPAGSSTGAAVIVAPGGGFLGLAMDTEGWQIARSLANHGIAAFVLKYRVLPTPPSLETFENEFNRMLRGEKVSFANPTDTPSEALADAMAALRYVRAHADEFRVDPRRLGFMGFSAGGFLTRSVIQSAGNEMPAFGAPIYPNMATMEVPANAPPIFVLIASDDFLLERGGLGLVQSWRAAKKPIEFHLVANGGHGFGLGRSGTSTQDWMELLYRWLGVNSLLTGE
jgi:acetyl esterase/lipase